MARNIGENLHDQNIILESKENNFSANENAANQNNSQNINVISSNSHQKNEQPPKESHLDTLNESVSETIVFPLFT